MPEDELSIITSSKSSIYLVRVEIKLTNISFSKSIREFNTQTSFYFDKNLNKISGKTTGIDNELFSLINKKSPKIIDRID